MILTTLIFFFQCTSYLVSFLHAYDRVRRTCTRASCEPRESRRTGAHQGLHASMMSKIVARWIGTRPTWRTSGISARRAIPLNREGYSFTITRLGRLLYRSSYDFADATKPGNAEFIRLIRCCCSWRIAILESSVTLMRPIRRTKFCKLRFLYSYPTKDCQYFGKRNFLITFFNCNI